MTSQHSSFKIIKRICQRARRQRSVAFQAEHDITRCSVAEPHLCKFVPSVGTQPRLMHNWQYAMADAKQAHWQGFDPGVKKRHRSLPLQQRDNLALWADWQTLSKLQASRRPPMTAVAGNAASTLNGRQSRPLGDQLALFSIRCPTHENQRCTCNDEHDVHQRIR